MNQGREVGRN
jgi:hypothetical protein